MDKDGAVESGRRMHTAWCSGFRYKGKGRDGHHYQTDKKLHPEGDGLCDDCRSLYDTVIDAKALEWAIEEGKVKGSVDDERTGEAQET